MLGLQAFPPRTPSFVSALLVFIKFGLTKPRHMNVIQYPVNHLYIKKSTLVLVPNVTTYKQEINKNCHPSL